MPPTRARSLIVFDLDGTLVDSRLDLAESTNELLTGLGAAPIAVTRVVSLVGDGAGMLVRRALEAAGLDPKTPGALERFLAIYDRRLLVHTRPYPGIEAVVRSAAARASLAVLTNKPAAPARRMLDAFDLAAVFTEIVGGDSGFPKKPDPAALEHLMTDAGADRSSTLLVGDSMVDVETARRAGIAICVAGYGFGQARGDLALGPDETVADTPAVVGATIQRFLDQRKGV